ncbi:MAG: rhomboid family intramembrane serine protease [Sedimentisphaerales bacterium]|nr:rhomboid family intramembrane serine protease [Sedimentisphaerales bacterium]
MFLPIRTNIWPRRTPYANYALIAANVIIFLLSYGGPFRYYLAGEMTILPIRPWAAQWMLIPAGWHVWQFLTYAFLHGGYMHIIGNMFFLYIFGNNINDKLGHLWYVLFYLAGAIFSGIGHTLVHLDSTDPTLGASGAVAAVTGAYLVLFPQTLITVLYWFFFIGTVEVPALWFIGLKMILLDNMIARYTAHVAYDAHMAGYTYGIGLTLLLLATRLISSSSFDLWAMIRQWNRRRLYRDTVATGYDPFAWTEARKRVEAREVPRPPVDAQKQAQIEQIRHEISRRIAQRNLPAAADLYLQLMQTDREQVLPRQHLLDVANQLASDQHPTEAAQAYEQFLTHYGNYEYAEQVELMLGILYARYLHRPQEAVEHLQRACERLSDPNQLEMCRQELARLQS